MIDTNHNTLGIQSVAPRRGTKLREIAYRAIKDAILQGTVRPDLPLVEERLATELQISRTPVREALAILEHEGLIESLPYQGLFVKDISVTEFLQMYEAAELIEPELARRATLHIQPTDISYMTALLQKAEQCIPSSVPGHLHACRLFFQRLGECAHQPYLTSLLLSIEERSDLYLISKCQTLAPEKMLAAVHDRYAILDALRTADPEQAAQASRTHVQALRLRWQELYGQPETHREETHHDHQN